MAIIIIIVAFTAVVWLMRNVPSLSNAILTLVGLSTFLGVLAKNKPEFLTVLSDAGARIAPAPDIADLLFNVKYKGAGGEIPESQIWWTLGTSGWVLIGSVINKSDKVLSKLKFEVFIKYGSKIIGDEAVATEHGWKVLPGQERAFTTYSDSFKDLPTTKWSPVWGIKLIEINNTAIKTDIVWSPDNPYGNPQRTLKKVRTLEIIPK
jgi:hypothetical protein